MTSSRGRNSLLLPLPPYTNHHQLIALDVASFPVAFVARCPAHLRTPRRRRHHHHQQSSSFGNNNTRPPVQCRPSYGICVYISELSLMSSNWTVVVFTQMVTGRSLSLSRCCCCCCRRRYIYTTKRPTICVQWCVSVLLSSLFSMLCAFGVLVWWCAVLLLLLLLFVPSFFSSSSKNWIGKNCTKKSSY